MKRMYDESQIKKIASEAGGGGGAKLYLHTITFQDMEGRSYYGFVYASNNEPYIDVNQIPDYLPVTASNEAYKGVGIYSRACITAFVTSGSTVEVLYEKDIMVIDTVTEV